MIEQRAAISEKWGNHDIGTMVRIRRIASRIAGVVVGAVFSRLEQRYGILFDAEAAATIDRSWPAPRVRAHTTPEPTTTRAHDDPPRYGVFELHANNLKKRGFKDLEYIDCYGALFPDGGVQLHTNKLGITDFLTWRQFVDYIAVLGESRIVWLALPTSAGEVPS